MQLFATDQERLAFLLESDAELAFEGACLRAEGRQVPPDARPKYVANYIGSKQKLVDWIWKNTPEGVGSVVDAFSGSAVVAYMYKTKGLRVVANDRLRYAHHAARALVENSSVTLTEEEIEALLAENPKAGTFVRDHFAGLFFAEGVHGLIDTIRANCDRLQGYKKDLALFALARICASGGFGHFSSTQESGMRKGGPDEFRDKFRRTAGKLNELVFSNGEDCKAHREDVTDLLPGVRADLAYFDPPYATEFSTTNYERMYHFVEGLMSYWDGLKIVEDSKTKFFESDHETVTKGNAQGFFEKFLGAAKHIPNWLISYRDHAYPNEEGMRAIVGSLGRKCDLETRDHTYLISGQNNEASKAKEYLFICAKEKAKSKAAEEEPIGETSTAEAPIHASVPIEIALSEKEPLQAAALDLGSVGRGDPQFTFTLCRVGTNKNGDHFSPEELSGRFTTAVNKKIDLQHSQDFRDIVGGIVSAEYIEDDKGGRVDCVGELYTAESEPARLAYKLIKKGIISQVSMECDYTEGECSICAKRVKSKADYCVHLQKYKGGMFQGKPVYEILHGVTFTGLGLLDRKGADENARITQVASHQEGASSMEDKEKQESDQPGTKNKAETDEKPPEKDEKTRVKELETENSTLKQQVAELQKRIQQLEAEQKSAANKSRAHKLLQRLEKSGYTFASDEDRETELGRLADLSDDAFTATEAAFERALAARKTAEKSGEESTGKPKAEASRVVEPLQSAADVRPLSVDDKKTSLEERLKTGFRAAYQDRLARTGAPTESE